METPLTRSQRVINFSVFSKLHSHSKSSLGCYIVKTIESVPSNDAPYER